MVIGCANGSIRVSDTSIRCINNVPVGSVSAQVMLKLSPTPRIHIEFDNIELPSDFDVSAEELDISLNSGTTFGVRTDLTRYEFSSGKLLCKGPFILARQSVVTVIEPGNDLKEVQFGLLNFPDFLGEEYLPPKTSKEIKEGYQRRDFVKLEASPWVIEVKSFKNTRETIKRLRADGGYGLTHEGSIRRSDWKSFSVNQVSPLMDLLRLFLSFARGANCGLTLVVGMNDKGQRVWEKWSASRPSPWSGERSWFDHSHGMTLAELFPGFYRRLWKAPEHHPLTMALHWYLLSNETRSLEGSIVLTQAALERLSQELAKAKGNRKEGVWIADALHKAGIPPEIPSELQKLKELANSMTFQHGPHTLVKMRNNLIHSEMKIETPLGDSYFQARELGLWYVELLLLRIFGYRGSHGNRLSQEWRGEVELVPWAVEGGDPWPT